MRAAARLILSRLVAAQHHRGSLMALRTLQHQPLVQSVVLEGLPDENVVNLVDSMVGDQIMHVQAKEKPR